MGKGRTEKESEVYERNGEEQDINLNVHRMNHRERERGRETEIDRQTDRNRQR